ncbi:MAG: type II secretion system protein E [Patescibacteria group bacterium]|nr:MAG: type II secretion system protein E [Patescibacteria group bacterium]
MIDPAQSTDPIQIPQTDPVKISVSADDLAVSQPLPSTPSMDLQTAEQTVQSETPLSSTDLTKIAESLEKDSAVLAANATDGALDETKVVPEPATVPLTVPTVPSVSTKESAVKKPEDAPGIDPNKTYSNVVDVLRDAGTISQDEANQILVENVSSGKTLEAILEENKFASEEQLTQAKSVVHKIPFVSIAEFGTDPQALTKLPEGVARNYNMLPLEFDKDKNSLTVAMKDPLDLSAIDFAEQKSGQKIIAYYAMPSELERKIAENYSQSLSSEVTAALEQTSQVAETKARQQDLSELSGETIREAPITKIVQTIVAFAMKARASDVHIEPQEQRTRVRYRIDGILVEKLILPRSVHEAVVSRIKILSGLKIDEKRIPQDGRFNFVSGDAEADLRISTLPTIHGEKIVMRLLKKDATVPALEELGLTGIALSRVKDAIKVPHGIVLVTGPTGSGKTTTLYSVLHTINTPKVNIMTLEDPVEYQMVGINQVQINPQAGLTFASGLRSFLRQDPNIIMVGEVRDSETAELAIQASLTGHLVFSTLHTSSAAGAIPRLLDMGAEPFLLASSMTLTMAQRVVRKINEEFKEEYKPEQAVVEDIKRVLGPRLDEWLKKKGLSSPEEIMLFRAKKDRPQTEPEYKGRVAIFEVMPVTEKIGKLILERKPATEMEKLAVADGMLFMKQDGYIKALEGLTTVEEVLRVAEI